MFYMWDTTEAVNQGLPMGLPKHTMVIHLHFDLLSNLLGALLHIKLINQRNQSAIKVHIPARGSFFLFLFLINMMWVTHLALGYFLLPLEICLDWHCIFQREIELLLLAWLFRKAPRTQDLTFSWGGYIIFHWCIRKYTVRSS